MVGDQDLTVAASARTSEVFSRMWGAYLATLTGAGADIGYGARIPTVLEDHGLQDVQANGESIYWRGGSLAAQFYLRGIDRLREQLLATGLIRDGDIDEFATLLTDPAFAWWGGVTWTGWGRKR